MKRQTISMESCDVKMKKLRTTLDRQKNSISCIENLPNEIFYEIFDYLEGCLLYEAFSNLNTRFQELLTCPSLRLKINYISYSESLLEHRSKHIILPNKHKIISFTFENAFGESLIFPWFPIHSGYNRLESLTLIDIRRGELLILLVGLIFLPRLFSLTIHLNNCSKDISWVYRLIFNLPKLKYSKLSSKKLERTVPLPIATDKQFSTIEYLIIDHNCTLTELITILSYTPRLSHLICKQRLKSSRFIEREVSSQILNLTYISFHCCCLWFDELEILIKNISSQLQELRINTYTDSAYLDADRWEQLITQYMPRLRLLKFNYIQKINEHLHVTPYHARINRFNSLFWSQRQWLFGLSIDTENQQDTVIVYSISPYRKTPDDFHEYEDPSNSFIMKCDQQSIQQIAIPLSQTNRLTILNLLTSDTNQPFMDIIRPILLLTSITGLNITCNHIFIGILIELVHLLPNLDYLIVRTLAMIQPRCLSIEEVKTLRLVSDNNKITKVKFHQMTEFAQIQFIINLCSRLQHLEVTCTNDIDPEVFLRFIFMKNTKYIPNLCSLCFCISNSNEDLFGKLQKIIELEKLHHDYTIKRSNNRIYLRWNNKHKENY